MIKCKVDSEFERRFMERCKRIGINSVDDAICYQPFGECILSDRAKEQYEKIINDPEKLNKELERLKNILDKK